MDGSIDRWIGRSMDMDIDVSVGRWIGRSFMGRSLDL